MGREGTHEFVPTLDGGRDLPGRQRTYRLGEGVSYEAVLEFHAHHDPGVHRRTPAEQGPEQLVLPAVMVRQAGPVPVQVPPEDGGSLGVASGHGGDELAE